MSTLRNPYPYFINIYFIEKHNVVVCLYVVSWKRYILFLFCFVSRSIYNTLSSPLRSKPVEINKRIGRWRSEYYFISDEG